MLVVSDVHRYIECGGVILACFDPQADGDNDDVKPNPQQIYFTVDDLEATYESCQKAGARFAEGEVQGDPAGKIAPHP